MAKTKDKPTLKIKTVAESRLDSAVGSTHRRTIVSGYDPKADFADVLRSWERSGEVSTLPKRSTPASVKSEQKKSFAEILAVWEGEEEQKPAKSTEPIKSSSPYKPTKDFGSLLDAFEGKSAKTRKVVEHSPRPAAQPTGPMTPSKAISEALEEKAELDAERGQKAAWSFADTYRQWSKQSDEEQAIAESVRTEREAHQRPRSLAELRALEPEETLDLHGMTVLEAEKASADFLRQASFKRLDKVAIITGKGLHNDKGYSLLREAALSQIRISGVVREAYTPKARYGGSGVIWILLKKG